MILVVILSLSLINIFIRIRKQPPALTFLLTLSISLPLSIIFLLPIDLISSATDASGDVATRTAFYASASSINVCWKVNYWLTFILTWLILPLTQYWYDSGLYHNRLKAQYALVSYAKYFALLLVVGIIGIAYLSVTKKITFTGIKSLLITVSHLYSLMLALWLMSFGLVMIPKTRYLLSYPLSSQIQQGYVDLKRIDEQYQDSLFHLKESCGLIHKMSNLQGSCDIHFRDWIIELAKDIPPSFSKTDLEIYYPENVTVQQLTNKFIADASRTFKKNLYLEQHHKLRFDELAMDISKMEDIRNGDLLKSLHFRTMPSSFLETWISKYPSLNYYLWRYVRPLSLKVQSLILFSLTAAIIESETFHGFSFSLISLVLLKISSSLVVVFIVFFTVLTYMLLCALYALYRVKIFNIYHISHHQSTDVVSLIFFITYAARLTIPLSYNFLMLLTPRVSDLTQFQHFLGSSIHLIPLGNFINNWLPRLLIIPVSIFALNLIGKLKAKVTDKLGLADFADDYDFAENDDTTTDRTGQVAQDGKRLLDSWIQKENGALRPFHLNMRRSTGGLTTKFREFFGKFTLPGAFHNKPSRDAYHDNNSEEGLVV